MTHIIAFSGRKQSGKDTLTNFILASELKELGVVHFASHLTPEGRIHVSDIHGDVTKAGVLETYLNIDMLKETIGVGIYAFADYLKEFCMKVLGLTYEQCYGDEIQKRSWTKYSWENMPGVVSHIKNPTKKYGTLHNYGEIGFHNSKIFYHQPGRMTARDVLKFFGTNICRTIHNTCWVDATINKIKNEQSSIWLAIILDCRFPNEVEAIQSHNGKVIRLLRNITGGHVTHLSESALDVFPLENYDAVIDNRKMNIEEQSKELYKILHNWKILNIPFFNQLLEREKNDIKSS